MATTSCVDRLPPSTPNHTFHPPAALWPCIDSWWGVGQSEKARNKRFRTRTTRHTRKEGGDEKTHARAGAETAREKETTHRHQPTTHAQAARHSLHNVTQRAVHKPPVREPFQKRERGRRRVDESSETDGWKRKKENSDELAKKYIYSN